MTETKLQEKGQPASDRTSSEPGVPLCQAAILLRAPLFKNEDHPDSIPFLVLSVIDIKDHGHTAFPGKEIRIRNLVSKARKYCLKPFDVVISIVGTVGKICIVPETVPDNWIPTSNMLIIRFRENRIDQSIAFAMLMHSPAGHAILDRLTHGTKISMISKKEFSRIHIPVPSEELLREARDLYDKEEALSGKIEECISEIRILRNSYLVKEKSFQVFSAAR